MRKRYDNEILEEGQTIVINRGNYQVESLQTMYKENNDGYGILRKKLYDKNNQQVWAMWWSAIDNYTYAGITPPQPIEPVKSE